MALPVWYQEGYRQHGPGRIMCPFCRRSLSSNALARAAHGRSKAHEEAVELARKARENDPLNRWRSR